MGEKGISIVTLKSSIKTKIKLSFCEHSINSITDMLHKASLKIANKAEEVLNNWIDGIQTETKLNLSINLNSRYQFVYLNKNIKY